MIARLHNHPRAEAFLRLLSKESIITWLTQYQTGRKAMDELEAKLNDGGKNGRHH